MKMIKKIKNINIPIMVLHGKKDTDCSIFNGAKNF